MIVVYTQYKTKQLISLGPEKNSLLYQVFCWISDLFISSFHGSENCNLWLNLICALQLLFQFYLYKYTDIYLGW